MENIIRYLLMDDRNNYIGIDYMSGGYPHRSQHFDSAELFITKSAAENYSNKFKSDNFILKEVIIQIQDVWS